MKIKFLYCLLISTALFSCRYVEDENEGLIEVPIGAPESDFIYEGGSITLESINAQAERFASPDRFLAYATKGAAKWEIFALTRAGMFKSDQKNSLTFIPDTTDLSKIYNVAADRADIEISAFNSDTTKVTLEASGVAHNSKTDSVIFTCSFTEVPLRKR